jgi:signal transduction histidine kinase
VSLANNEGFPDVRDSLERQVEDRTRELTMLLQISRDVASTLEIQPLLRLLVDQIRTVVDYWRARLFLLKDGALHQIVNPSEERTSTPALEPRPIDLRDLEPMWGELCAGRPVIIGDVRGEGAMAAVWQRTTTERPGSPLPTQSLLAVPVSLKDQTLGMITLSHAERNYYTHRHAQLVMAIASQAAVAVENARLYQQAGYVAALEERQRLARELHDSVSQALYGIALSVTAAQTHLDQTDSPARKPLEYAMTLTQAAMAEMRALIFELRPESLEVEGLVVAIEKQVAAIAARHGIMIQVELCEEPDVPQPLKEVLYRVCQEALHNVVKHSGASFATVFLTDKDGQLVLEIADKGRGFDTRQSFPGHMGLISMPERATKIGATLEIRSVIGEGTTIRLTRKHPVQ